MKKSRRYEVLLRQNVNNLGARGEVVSVAPGYARNFLFPKGVAYPVTEENRKRINAERVRARAAEEQHAQTITDLRAAVEALGSVSIEVRAGEEGRLFGSVTARAIAEALTAAGCPVEESAVHLEEPFKEVGTYDVPIRLTSEEECSLRVWVVREREE